MSFGQGVWLLASLPRPPASVAGGNGSFGQGRHATVSGSQPGEAEFAHTLLMIVD